MLAPNWRCIQWNFGRVASRKSKFGIAQRGLRRGHQPAMTGGIHGADAEDYIVF